MVPLRWPDRLGTAHSNIGCADDFVLDCGRSRPSIDHNHTAFISNATSAGEVCARLLRFRLEYGFDRHKNADCFGLVACLAGMYGPDIRVAALHIDAVEVGLEFENFHRLCRPSFKVATAHRVVCAMAIPPTTIPNAIRNLGTKIHNAMRIRINQPAANKSSSVFISAPLIQNCFLNLLELFLD